ncbi:hypothetical protein Daus18300_011675 [Diaporthe australafricana]|uniref:NAD-dependent epimerase/dehydratase domain-containing protein n=1 Tax=Diaporthe australafricana TaxID=127596 RepID=A0ABR3W5U0_9PEZI
MAPHELAVPKGSTVLVTGVNGLLGSHTADQFLEHGYKVRGTVRDTEKNAWIQALFDKKYGKGSFELFKVADLTAEGAFDEAVKGTSVVAHSASIVTFAADPNAVIPQAIAFAVNALKSAYKEPSVKRFVLTSSSSAAVVSDPSVPGAEITEDSWSEAAVKAAWADPPYTEDRGGVVYAASKTQSEQEVWKYHKENRSKRPDLVVNTEYYIDVQDTGRLHVAAAIFDDVKDQRIFGFAGRFNWDQVLDILRKTAPNKKFPDNFSGASDPNEIKPVDKAEQLLRDLGRPGWTSLEETVLANISDVRDN